MANEKCACHLKFPDGQKVAIKDSYAREQLERLQESNLALARNITDLRESNRAEHQTIDEYTANLNYKAGKNAQSITEITESINDLRAYDSEIRENLEYSIATALRVKKVEFRNSVEVGNNIFKDVAMPVGRDPEYIDVCCSLDSNYYMASIVRLPFKSSITNCSGKEYTLYKKISIPVYDSSTGDIVSEPKIIAKFIVTHTIGSTSNSIRVLINPIYRTGVYKLRVENILFYFIDDNNNNVWNNIGE
jgi:hypothetical protein